MCGRFWTCYRIHKGRGHKAKNQSPQPLPHASRHRPSYSLLSPLPSKPLCILHTDTPRRRPVCGAREGMGPFFNLNFNFKVRRTPLSLPTPSL